MLPTPCTTDQATCWFVAPVTDAVNCTDCPPNRKTEEGETEIETEGVLGRLEEPVITTAVGDRFTCAREELPPDNAYT